MTIEQELSRFKIQLLRKMPFYGDIVMNVPFVESKSVDTAATNGSVILYNSNFLKSLSEGERNFVIMHELMHIILRHSARYQNSKRDQSLWNTACDLLVNQMLVEMNMNFSFAHIAFEKPKIGVFGRVSKTDTAENIYKMLEADNQKLNNLSKKIIIRDSYCWNSPVTSTVEIPTDLINGEGGRSLKINGSNLQLSEDNICRVIADAARKYQSNSGSYYIPQAVYKMIEGKRLNWKTLLKDFLTEELGDDTSYSTPERKYLHMDMILPGHSLSEEKIEEIWAFVDSSGSIGNDEMSKFLTQLYRISKEFKCVFNICYWDTAVTDVYKKITDENQILKCLPRHSGGTNINCIYDWMEKNKVKPGVMLVLTDGYFGTLYTSAFKPSMSKRTILVLSSDIAADGNIKKVGKIAKL